MEIIEKDGVTYIGIRVEFNHVLPENYLDASIEFCDRKFGRSVAMAGYTIPMKSAEYFAVKKLIFDIRKWVIHGQPSQKH